MGLKSIFMFTRIVRWCVTVTVLQYTAGWLLYVFFVVAVTVLCYLLFCLVLYVAHMGELCSHLSLPINTIFFPKKKRLVVDLCFQVQVHECVFYCWYLF